MRNTHSIQLLVLGTVLAASAAFSSCSTGRNRSPAFATEEGSTWSGKMRDLSKNLSELLPIVNSQSSFDQNTNREKIESLTKELTGLTHDISKAKFTQNQDPGISALNAQFEGDIAEAVKNLKAGDRVSARARLHTATAYCISCHSMGGGNGSPFALDLHPDLSKSTELDKAQYYASTRQFDQAMIHYEYALVDPKWANNHPAQWNDAVQKLLAIVVRVKNDPSLAMEMVSRFFDAKSYPKSLAPVARNWKKQIREWRLEKNHLRMDSMAQLTLAKKLIVAADHQSQARAERHTQNFMVVYLRASGYLHQYLTTADRSDAGYPEALYYSGLSAEQLQDANLWNLSRDYFEKCTQLFPGTPTAAKCQARLSLGAVAERDTWRRNLAESDRP